VGHAHSMGVFALAFDPRTGLLASASHDYSVILWDFERRDAVFVLGGPDARVSRRALAFAGTQLLVADGMTWRDVRATLTAIDLESGEAQILMRLDKDLGIGAMAVSDEIAVAIYDPRGGFGHGIRLLHPDGRERLRIEPQLSVQEMSLLPNLLVATVATEGGGTELVVFDRARGARRASRVLGEVLGACVSAQGDELVVAYGNAVEVCEVATLAPRRRIELGSEEACSVAWSHGCIAVGTAQKTLRLFT